MMIFPIFFNVLPYAFHLYDKVYDEKTGTENTFRHRLINNQYNYVRTCLLKGTFRQNHITTY